MPDQVLATRRTWLAKERTQAEDDRTDPDRAPARPSLGGPFDAVSAAIGAGAVLALFRLRAGVIPVVLGCGLLGLVLTLVRAG